MWYLWKELDSCSFCEDAETQVLQGCLHVKKKILEPDQKYKSKCVGWSCPNHFADVSFMIRLFDEGKNPFVWIDKSLLICAVEYLHCSWRLFQFYGFTSSPLHICGSWKVLSTPLLTTWRWFMDYIPPTQSFAENIGSNSWMNVFMLPMSWENGSRFVDRYVPGSLRIAFSNSKYW